MKKTFLKLIPGLCISLFFLNCNNSTKETETTTADSVKQEATENKTTGVANEFVTKVGSGSMMEIALAKLAQTNGGSQDVKDFGKMLETDHTSASETLQRIATAENINFPTAMTDEQAMHVKDMEAKKGTDFDKDFISMMVEGHTKNIDLFKDAAAGNSNEKVKDFAAKTLPVLQKHLDRAKAIQSKIK